MKILVINQGNTKNYGDIAINETLCHFFLKKDIEVYNLIYWNEEMVFGKNYFRYNKFLKNILWKKMFLVDKLNYMRIKKFVGNEKYDAIVIGGGELIGNHLGFNSSLSVITRFFLHSKTPIFLYGVSGDVNMDDKYLCRYRKALSNICYICVRDNKTKSNIKKCYNIDTHYAPDVVFARNNILMKKSKFNNNRKFVTIIPIEYYDEIKKGLKLNNRKEYFMYMLEIIKKNLNKKDIIYITSTAIEDDKIVYDFYKYLLENNLLENEVSFSNYSSLDEFENILINSRLVISARMHGLILALNNNCEIITIPFKEKLKEFGKTYTNPNDSKNNSKLVIESLNDMFEKMIEKGKNYE